MAKSKSSKSLQYVREDNPVLKNAYPGDIMTSEGEVIECRFTCPEDARAVHKRNWDDDEPNRASRAEIQAMLDGSPPWDPEELEQMGLGGCSNINWGNGHLAIRRKMQPYIQAYQSTENHLEITTSFGKGNQSYEYSRIITEEWNRMIRSHRSFYKRYLFNVLYYVSHGISYCYFDDDIDWMWNVSTTGETVVPRKTKSDAEEFDVVSTVVEYSPIELFSFISKNLDDEYTDEDEQGWCIEAVKEVIMSAKNKPTWDNRDWEAIQASWKNNDLRDTSTAKSCRCVIMRVKESDGTVTQLIFPEDTPERFNKKSRKYNKGGKEKFLYKKKNYFRHMQSWFVPFMASVGTNGFIHSVRGTGSNIYPIVQSMDMLYNKFYDALNSDLLIPITGSEEALSNGHAFTQFGPFMLLPEGVSYADRKARNIAEGVIPGINMLKQDSLERQGGEVVYGGENVDIFSNVAQMSGLDLMESSLFYESWETLLRESLRRTVRIVTKLNSKVPGGDRAWKFYRKCISRGVPKEAFSHIEYDLCYAYTPIGNGSSRARQQAQEYILSISPNFDEQGRRNAIRDAIAAIPGASRQHVDRYAPPVPDMRPGIEAAYAFMENQLLMNGMEAAVLPDQDHLLHLKINSQPIAEVLEIAESGEISLGEAANKIYPLYAHCIEHLEMFGESDLYSSELAGYRKALFNAGEVINNGFKQLAKERQMAEENIAKGLNPDGSQPVEGQQPSGQVPEGPNPSQMKQLVQAQTILWTFRNDQARRQQMHEAKMEALKAETEHKLRLQDLRNSAAMLEQQRKMRNSERL